ncbi:MAG: tRNA lysidine(34) synthetase TilS [Nitrospinae bacterium]|nr:tRNA lysidine(34) synthetase TilS [Nitrospinota bacterium]
MANIVNTALSSILRHGMIPPGSVVMSALSGGPDSVALLITLMKLREKLGIRELKVCHYDHAFRPDSGRDADFSKTLAGKLGLDFVMERNSASKPESDLQQVARKLRYSFFDRLLDEGRADIIATGHTLDDSVETFLLWLLRGSGPQALGGVPPVRGKYVRPLIEARKSEILEWLREQSVDFVTDPTNAGDDYLRNKIRHQVIPAMESVSPSAVNTISRAMRLVGGQTKLIGEIAGNKMKSVVKTARADGVTLDAEMTAVEPEAIRFVIYREAVRLAGLDPAVVSLKNLEALDCLVSTGRKGAATDLPGGFGGRYDHAGLSIFRKKTASAPMTAPFACPLKLEWDDGTLAVTPVENGNDAMDCVSISAVPPGAVFRARKPGDYLHLPNLAGRKTLKTFLIDRKMPSGERGRTPLLAVEGEILWIPGLFIALAIAGNSGSGDSAKIEWRPQ